MEMAMPYRKVSAFTSRFKHPKPLKIPYNLGQFHTSSIIFRNVQNF
jgi:hypothetical protein